MDPVLPLGLDVSLRWGLVYGDRDLVIRPVGGISWQVEWLTPQIKYIFSASALPSVQLSCLFPVLPIDSCTAFIGCLCDDMGMVDVYQAAYKVENLCVAFLGSFSRRHCMPQLASSKRTFVQPPACWHLHICGGFEQRQGTSPTNIWGSPVATLHCACPKGVY